MTVPDPNARQARLAAIVIVAAFLLWMGISALGGWLGLPPRYAFLADLLAMAAMAWALVVLFKVWRARSSGAQD